MHLADFWHKLDCLLTLFSIILVTFKVVLHQLYWCHLAALFVIFIRLFIYPSLLYRYLSILYSSPSSITSALNSISLLMSYNLPIIVALFLASNHIRDLSTFSFFLAVHCRTYSQRDGSYLPTCLAPQSSSAILALSSSSQSLKYSISLRVLSSACRCFSQALRQY